MTLKLAGWQYHDEFFILSLVMLLLYELKDVINYAWCCPELTIAVDVNLNSPQSRCCCNNTNLYSKEQNLSLIWQEQKSQNANETISYGSYRIWTKFQYLGYKTFWTNTPPPPRTNRVLRVRIGANCILPSLWALVRVAVIAHVPLGYSLIIL